MKIKKILNHNAALAVDSAGNEIVYTGCGICFQKKAGDPLDESKIEKTFVMEKHHQCNPLSYQIKICFEG